MADDRATLKDIARHTGLGLMTVSRALRGEGYVAPKTREKILRTASKLGYQANRSARAVRTGKFHNIGVIMSCVSFHNTLFREFMEEVDGRCAAEKLSVTLARLKDEKLTDESYMRNLKQNLMADGFLVGYIIQIPARMEEYVQKYSIPTIWTNSKHSQDCVHPDDISAGKRATEYLIQRGHRHIMFIDYSDSKHYSTFDRQEGYTQAMQQAGLCPNIFRKEGKYMEHDEVLQVVKEWMKRDDRPTGIVSQQPSNLTPILAVATDMGLRIPDDISFITFDTEFDPMVRYPVTTLRIPDRDMGRIGMDMLLKKIKNPTPPQPAVALPFGFFPGATVTSVKA